MATAWANQQQALIIETPKINLSWTAFVAVLHEHFQLQNDSAEAIHQIRTMEMGTSGHSSALSTLGASTLAKNTSTLT